MKSIVIFASGSGTNAENIIRYFNATKSAKVVAVFCNNPKAAVIEKVESYSIPLILFSKSEFSTGLFADRISSYAPDLIVLAGFLLMVPSVVITKFEGKIINIHPALLPKFGGAGMYGMNVHKAVVESGESQTGITIHYIDQHYDSGDIIAQFSTPLNGTETCEEVAARIHVLEQTHFPKVIEQLLIEKI